jgi:hypothetical protein
MTTAAVDTFRIGGEGRMSPRHTVSDLEERLALVDRELERVITQGGGVLILEVDRDGDGFARLDRFRHGQADPSEPPYDVSSIDFLRVGIADTVGAAEHWGRTILATHNPRPSESDRHRVLYDACVALYFPSETVVPLAQVRQLMQGYALRGEWAPDVPGRVHDDLVA